MGRTSRAERRYSEIETLAQQEKELTPEQAIGSFMNHIIVKNTLLDHKAGQWKAEKLSGSTRLILFQKYDAGGLKRLALPGFLHTRYCIGIVVANSPEEAHRAYLEQLPRLLPEGISGEKFGLMIATYADLISWQYFLNHVSEEGLIAANGARAYEISGLDRVSSGTMQKAENNLRIMLQRGNQHLTFSDSYEALPGLFLDFVATDKSGQVVPVMLAHIMSGMQTEMLLYEQVSSDLRPIIGWLRRLDGESKGEAYARLNLAQQQLDEAGYGHLQIALLSPGQVKLLDKMGQQPRKGYLSEKKADGDLLDLETLDRYLFYGESTVLPGILARLGFSLANFGSMMPELSGGRGTVVDAYVFNSERGTISALPRPIWGLNLSDKSSVKKQFLPLGDVCGFAIIPEEMPVTERKEYAKNLNRMVQSATQTKGQIALVTRSLLLQWIESGFFVDESELFNEIRQMGQDKALEYRVAAQSTGNVRMREHRIEVDQAVGGAFTAISTKVGSQVDIHFVNVGAQFSAGNAADRMIGSGMPTVMSIYDDLLTGAAPMIPDAYDYSNFVVIAQHFPICLDHTLEVDKRSAKHYLHWFIRMELRRLPKDLLRQWLSPTSYDLLQKARASDYARAPSNYYQHSVNTVLINHSHADHTGQLPKVNRRVVIVGGNIQIAGLKAIAALARLHNQNPLVVSDVHLPKAGAAYHKVQRQWIAYPQTLWQHQIDADLTVTAHAVDHSMPADAFLFRTLVGCGAEGSLVTGDIKLGKWTSLMVNRFAGEDIAHFNFEATNAEGSRKISIGKSEKDVHASLIRVMSDESNKGRAMAIACPRNHSLRLDEILDVARAMGRRVAIHPAHIMFLYHYFDEISLADAQYRPDLLERIMPILAASLQNGQREGLTAAKLFSQLNFSLWKWPQTEESRVAVEYNLAELSAGGVVSAIDIVRNPGDWVIVIPPNVPVKKVLLGLDERQLAYIHSTYFPYQSSDKMAVMANFARLRNGGARIYCDFTVKGGVISWECPDPSYLFHASGHGSEKEIEEQVMIPLIERRLMAGKPVVITRDHGQDIERRNLRLLERLQSHFRLDNPGLIRVETTKDIYKPQKAFRQDAEGNLIMPGHTLDFEEVLSLR